MEYYSLGILRFNFGSDYTEEEVTKAAEAMRENDHLIFDIPTHVNCRCNFVEAVN